jgi:hypothetical protein
MRPCIVLVHIGDVFFDYINICLKQIRKFNDCEIFLVMSDLHQNKIKCAGVNFISLENLNKSEYHLEFLRTNKLDSAFRSGFWKSATERFFVLNDVVIQYNLKNIFHFENDVMIYCDLEGINEKCLVNKFEMLAPFDNHRRCIPSFVFFKDTSILSELNKFILRYNNMNDMELLSQFEKESDQVGFLPVVPPNYQWRWKIKLLNRNLEKFSENYIVFESIFDAAALGQFLGGADSRNLASPSKLAKGFINESALYKASSFDYIWESDDKGREIPHIIYNGHQIKINNLHVHSKNLIDFFK